MDKTEKKFVSAETHRVPLSEGPLQIGDQPIAAFLHWIREAADAGVVEPTAMTLATCTVDGKPSARIVLFKGTSRASNRQIGIEFYTNYESQKSRELKANPLAALVFHWPTLRRQIRLEGRVEVVTPEESNAYFQTRARGSRIGAWSSPQSRKIGDRSELVQMVAATEKRFQNDEIPCPPNWGGWRLIPNRIEFWEERPHRLHERKVFELVESSAHATTKEAAQVMPPGAVSTGLESADAEGTWLISRLAP